MKKIEAKYQAAKKSNPDVSKKIFWEEFYGLEDINAGIAGQFDRTRDAIIFKHLDIARKIDPSMKFEVGYSGSASGVGPNNVDAANLRKDRDLLFLGPDGPRAMAYFNKSIRKEYGSGWGSLFDADAYVDSKYDDISALIHNRKDLDTKLRSEALDIWNDHRKILNEKLEERIALYKKEAVIKNDKSPEELNQLLLEMSEYRNAWDTHKDLDALKNYLRVNREYGLAMKDAYLTPGARKVEVELRSIWEKEYGLKTGDDWARYADELASGKLSAKRQKMPKVEAIDGLEVIRENLKEVHNKSKKAMHPDEIATASSKYYERAMRSGILIRETIDLRKISVGNGKSAEELRRLAMRIKERKNIDFTKAEIMKFYGKDPKKPDMETMKRYLNDCKKAVADVENQIRSSMTQ